MITLMVVNHRIESKSYVRYLGVKIDARLEHLDYISSKAVKANAILMRIMLNVRNSRSI